MGFSLGPGRIEIEIYLNSVAGCLLSHGWLNRLETSRVGEYPMYPVTVHLQQPQFAATVTGHLNLRRTLNSDVSCK